MSYETVIGLEIHVQLNTSSKAFCMDRNGFNQSPNTNISFISLAHPGTLPRMNEAHIAKAVKLGIAFKSDINKLNFFDRKNYFYPDLPKGYQITQDKEPFCRRGTIQFISEGQTKSIRLHHIHMEEDAGKTTHDLHDQFSMVDINRAGVPLLEIVTEPDFRSGQEVSDFLAELQKVVQYLDISDGNMEEGSFRCDCNVSVRKIGALEYGERCEIKNMNSRRNAKHAIEYEAKRQIKIIEGGGKIPRSTLLFDIETGETRLMRKKESENDYRYFPEPDLPPILLTDDFIEKIKSASEYLPIQLYQKLKDEFQLSHADAEVLVEQKSVAYDFLRIALKADNPKDLGDLFIQKLLPHINKDGSAIKDIVHDDDILMFLKVMSSGKISKSALYQHVFPVWVTNTNQNPMDIAEQKGLVQSDDQSFLDELISSVIAANPDKTKEYKKGKKGLLGFFMGQVMQKSGGKADPKTMQSKIEDALK